MAKSSLNRSSALAALLVACTTVPVSASIDIVQVLDAAAISADSISNFNINPSGVMAFVAGNLGASSATGTRVVRRLPDGTLQTLANSPSSTTTNPAFYRTFNYVAINESGVVALRSTFGGSANSNRAVAIETFSLNSTTPVQIVKDAPGTVAPNGPLNASIGLPSINSAGDVFYNVEYDTTSLGREYRRSPSTGGAFTTLGTATASNPPTITPSPIIGSTSVATFGSPAQLALDNGDLLMYVIYRNTTGAPNNLGQDAIVRYSAADGTFTRILDEVTSPDPSLRPEQYTSISNINSSGVFANLITLPPAIPGELGTDGVIKYDTVNNTMSLLAQESPGIGNFGRIDSKMFALDNGSVVFGAFVDTGVEGDLGVFGLFDGPSPVSDRIVSIGDTLFGGVVRNLTLEATIESTNTVYFSYGVDTNADTFSDQFGIASFVVPNAPSFVLGDFNFDGGVDASDIDPFVLAANEGDPFAAYIASSQAAFALLYPGQTLTADVINSIGDFNGDGGVDASDIDPFVIFANNGGAGIAAIPEPAALGLLAPAALLLSRRRR